MKGTRLCVLFKNRVELVISCVEQGCVCHSFFQNCLIEYPRKAYLLGFNVISVKVYLAWLADDYVCRSAQQSVAIDFGVISYLSFSIYHDIM